MGFEVKIYNFGFRLLGFRHSGYLGFRVIGFGVRVVGLGVEGLGCKVLDTVLQSDRDYAGIYFRLLWSTSISLVTLSRLRDWNELACSCMT